MKVLAATIAILFVLLISADISRSQSVPANAALSGTLSDPSGAAISGAQISVTPETLDPAVTKPLLTTTNKDGQFALSVSGGRYLIRITHPSFITHEETLDLSAAESRTLDLTLPIERLAATIIVTAQAEPTQADSTTAPVTVLTRKQIDQRQATSLPDLLLLVPGLSLGRTGREGGLTSLFLNGGNSNFIKVLVDGTPVNQPGGSVDFSNFTLDNVAKVEVVRGAESALYGSDAMVGVIQLFTHRGTTRTPEFTLLAEGGSFSTGRGTAQLSGVVGQFDYSAATAYLSTDGQGPNDRFLNRTLSGNFGWRLTDTNQLRLTLRNNTSSAGIAGPTLLAPPNLDQHNDTHSFSSNLRWDFQTGALWHHELVVEESYLRQLIAFPPFSFLSQFNRAGFTEQSSYLLRRGAVTGGYHYEVENGSAGGPHSRRNNQAGYVDTRFLAAPRLMISAGARAESNDSFGTRVVPRAGLAYTMRLGRDFWGATRLRFSYGEGIKEPRFDQSFSTNPCIPGNPKLRPERSRTFNAGLDQRLAADRLRLSADFFHNRFRDIVSFASGQFLGTPPSFCGDFFGGFFNTDLARARGLDLVAEARPAPWLTVSGNYTYDGSRVLQAPNAFDPASLPGNRLLRRPVHSGNLAANAAFRRMNWNVYAYFTGRRADSTFLNPTVTSTPGYARFDLTGSYSRRRNLSVFGRIENLFDKRYQEALGFPALGRDYRLGLRYTIGGE